jgi:hypothetical protein
VSEHLESYQHSRKRKAIERLLGLEELTKVVRPTSTHYAGLQDVRVADIIGTENRSAYFGEDFLPLSKWMDSRWLKVRELMLSGELTEPIQVFEYGGYYFVPSGNHRFSYRQGQHIEYLSPSLPDEIPIRLCPGKTRSDPEFYGKVPFPVGDAIFRHPAETFRGQARRHLEPGSRSTSSWGTAIT